MIFVAPDGQRTMNTYLGACVELGPDDVDPDLVAGADITYLEGYLWDRPEAKAACRKAATICHGAGRQLALTLSDSFCVERWRGEFRELVEHEVDILFANESELTSLYEVADFDSALQAVRRQVDFAALTRGPKGSVVVRGDEVHVIDAVPPDRLLDTTGRRGPLRRRVPARPGHGSRPCRLRPARQCLRCRDHRSVRRQGRAAAAAAARAGRRGGVTRGMLRLRIVWQTVAPKGQ